MQKLHSLEGSATISNPVASSQELVKNSPAQAKLSPASKNELKSRREFLANSVKLTAGVAC